MAESDFQAFIARLCVDAQARDRFLSEESIDAGPELTIVERSRLRTLQRSGGAGLRLLADILSGKRQSRTRSLLPRFAAHVTDSDWRRIWESYVRVECPIPPPSARHDAASFARFASASVEDDRVSAAILEYDAAFNEVAGADTLNPCPPQPATLDDAYGFAALAASPRLVKMFTLDVLALFRNQLQSQRTATTAASTLMFYRPFGVDTVRVSRVGDMTARLLDLADGSRTLAGLLNDTQLQPSPSAAGKDARIRDLLQRLWTAGALCFVEPPAGSREHG